MSKLSVLIRDLGWWWALLYALDRGVRSAGGRRFIYPYAIVRQAVAANVGLPEVRKRQLTWRAIDRWSPELEVFPTPKAVMERRFGSGARCLLAYHRGSLIGFAWLIDTRYEEDEVRCTFMLPKSERAVWDFDVQVLPDRRGTLAFAYLWQCVLDYFESAGIAATYSRISRFNAASLKSHLRLGGRIEAHLLFLVAGTAQMLVAARKPYLHFVWRNRDAPVVRVAEG